ncbi:Hypothetical predicted protein [Paramuricea clavata]|uniref:Uncharacterized protein n=1 Tax=Paramuricea clavata TaxID=317549 RepID=A0A6S7GG55_PARCT|nr:Hypothetical predicted protein [Paramuricea clavata]
MYVDTLIEMICTTLVKHDTLEGVMNETDSADKILAGVVQFADRVNMRKLRTAMLNVEFQTSYLECVRLPMVLPHLRIWLLCLHHDLPESEIKERGNFALGGRNRDLEDDMAPYRALLKDFMKTKDYTLCVHLKAGRKICKYADALDRLPIDGV